MADVTNDPRPVLRQELARVFKNQRVIRAFEKIFDLVPPEFNNQAAQIAEIFAALSVIDNELSEAPAGAGLLEQVAELAKQVEGLRQAPADLAEQVAELRKQVDALQQGPII